MKKTALLVLLACLAVLGMYAQPVVSCHDVQYTTAASGDSPYVGQVVKVQAVVTGTNFYSGSGANNFGFFISDAMGGAFSGLFVYNQQYFPAQGDLVEVTGTVTEYYGFTELTSLTAFAVLSQNNPIPAPSFITTAALSSSTTAEQWESVLVKVQNANVVSVPGTYQEFSVTDGSGNCQVDNQFFSYGHTWQNISLGQVFTELTGVVDYAYSVYGLNPRSLADMQSGASNLALTLPELTVNLHNQVTVPLSVIGLEVADGHQSYHLNVNYNPNIISYQSVSNAGTISAAGTLNVTPSAGTVAVNYSSNAALNGTGVLLNLNFMGISTGISPLELTDVYFSTTAVEMLINGSVRVNSNYNAPGDTLTVIQRPIMNIPAIQIPGETLWITCIAPQNTTGFNAWLVHGNKRIAMPYISGTWQTQPNRWELQVTVPQVNVFELYDLEVNANGGIHDISQNAVHVLPSRKSSYYFVHLTDLHMPTRIFYPDAGWNADSLAVVDFRAVMDDINLIRPEFVLISGDLINEGEMEGFGGQYWFGWVQRVLSEMEVPIYVTAGNHDIGGWDSTPPVDGSSRRSWWKYFGWKWLDNADVNWPAHTQDYNFIYGNTMFIGLEGYNNYENWRTNIYGSDSFTNQQILWLHQTATLFPEYRKVLFHHYDFQDQLLNLGSFGIGMALWGHTHNNSGDLSVQPYNISTRSTCDGNRAYRVIRVNEDAFTPLSTVSAGAGGNNLRVSYFPSNYAVADSVMAVINNGQAITFENTLIKFNMPSGNGGYTVTGGVLEQVDRSGAFNVCYVRVNLLQNSVRNVSIAASGVGSEDLVAVPLALHIASCYPNPMLNSAELEIVSDKASFGSSVEVYNLKGQKVQELALPALVKGTNRIAYTSEAGMPSGIYFMSLKDSAAKPYRFVIVK